MNLASGHSARLEGKDLVVEAGQLALMLGHQSRFERPVAIARHIDGECSVVGQHCITAHTVARIGCSVRLVATWRIAEMVGQLAAARALYPCFLEPTDRRIERIGRDRSLAYELVENFAGYRASGVSGVRLFRLRRIASPHAMPQHTKFRIPSMELNFPKGFACTLAPLHPAPLHPCTRSSRILLAWRNPCG